MKSKVSTKFKLITFFITTLLISIFTISISNYQASANNSINTPIETPSTNITSENYQPGLSEYIEANKDKFDYENPMNLIDEFMEKNNLDSIIKYSN